MQPRTRADTWTVRDILATTTKYFDERDILTSRLDAERLIAHVLKCDRIELYAEPERVVEETERASLRELVMRRGKHEPAQYILGNANFYSLTLNTDSRALCPRRETELLVDEALKIAKANPDYRILEIGTGTGAISLALASNLPQTNIITATDISHDTLALAQENAKKLELDTRINFLLGNLFEPIADNTKFDIIAANLPYISSSECETLMPEVKDFEPRGALDGGPDGLDVIRECVEASSKYLNTDGHILLEHGALQAEAITEIFEKCGYQEITTLRDPGNFDRVTSAKLIN